MHRRRLTQHVGAPIPDDAWAVFEELGGVSLQRCFVEVEDREITIERFVTAEIALRLWDTERRPPPGLLHIANCGMGQLFIVVGGPLDKCVAYESGLLERKEPPDWLAVIVATSGEDAPALPLEPLDLVLGVETTFPRNGELGFDDAVGAPIHRLADPTLRSALRECHHRSPRFRCIVHGPYGEEPVVLPGTSPRSALRALRRA